MEGFLLGSIDYHDSQSISDSDVNIQNTNIIINVSGYIPNSAMGKFYSGSGRVDVANIEDHRYTQIEEIIGWYHSRNFSETNYLKEMIVHRQLKKEMRHTEGRFLFAVFSRTQNADSGTLDVTYKFQIMSDSNEFEVVPLRILNMNDTSSEQYIKMAPSNLFYDSKSIQGILESVRFIEPGVKETEQLHKNLLTRLRTILPKFSSVQEQHQRALQRVNEWRGICYNAGVVPSFKPSLESECDFNLIDLESFSFDENHRSVKKVSSGTLIQNTINSNEISQVPLNSLQESHAKILKNVNLNNKGVRVRKPKKNDENIGDNTAVKSKVEQRNEKCESSDISNLKSQTESENSLPSFKSHPGIKALNDGSVAASRKYQTRSHQQSQFGAKEDKLIEQSKRRTSPSSVDGSSDISVKQQNSGSDVCMEDSPEF